MSISNKIYKRFYDIKRVVESKTFVNSLAVFLSILFFFITFNAYAADEGLSADYEGEMEFTNITNDVPDSKESNAGTGNALDIQAALFNATVRLGGEDILSEEIQGRLEESDVPYDLRRGLIGMTEDAGTAVYANLPLVDIPGHLAQQWVPGYDKSVSSLYAQNSVSGHPSGFDELKSSGINGLWRRSLDLSYILFVVVMVVAGFMIMFRHKLQGQAVVTLGSVLPRVIISLIFATFSFAIAGLIIDLGGILIGIILYVLKLSDATAISGIGPLLKSVFSGGGGLGLSSAIGGVTGALGIGGAFAIAGGGIAALLASPAAIAVAGLGIVGLLLALGVLGIILFGAFKVLITLLKSYFMLLISVVLGPLQITLGAIPGNNTAIKNWFFSILRNVLVFPVVFFIVNLPNAILASGTDMIVRFPGKLVYQDPATYNATGVNAAGGFFLWILKIFVLFFAAQAPKFLESIFPPNTSSGLGAGFAASKEGLSKVPLIGGFFKGK